MSYQSEAQLEDLLIRDLEKRGYSRVVFGDKDAREENFRENLFQFNAKVLEGKLF